MGDTRIKLTSNAKKVMEKLINESKKNDISSVNCIWNSILPIFNINIDNGYIIEFLKEEKINSNNELNISIMIIKKYNNIVFFIFCKSNNKDIDIDWYNILPQVHEYIIKLNCKKCIIAIGHKFKFFVNDIDHDINDLKEYTWNVDFEVVNSIYDNIVKFIKKTYNN